MNARFVVQVDGYDLRAVDVTGRDDLVCNHTTVDPVQFVWNAETTHEEKHSALHGLAKRARERGSDEIIFHTNLKETTYQNGIASDAAERQRQFQEALERIEGLYCSRERAKECLAFFLERLTKDKDAEDLESPCSRCPRMRKRQYAKRSYPTSISRLGYASHGWTTQRKKGRLCLRPPRQSCTMTAKLQKSLSMR